jgi:hypothetical protein
MNARLLAVEPGAAWASVSATSVPSSFSARSVAVDRSQHLPRFRNHDLNR